MDGWFDEQIDGQMDGQMDRCTCMDKLISDGGIGGMMDGWVVGYMNGWLDCQWQ